VNNARIDKTWLGDLEISLKVGQAPGQEEHRVHGPTNHGRSFIFTFRHKGGKVREGAVQSLTFTYFFLV